VHLPSHRRAASLAAASAALCLGLVACGSSLSPMPSGSAKLIDITVGNDGGYDAYGYVIAQQLGLWKAAGLKAHPEQFSAPLEEVPALTRGSLDFAYVGAGAAHLAMKGQAVIIAVNDFDISDFVLADPPISTLADLRGKTVAFGEGTAGQILLSLALGQAGLTLKDIHPVNIPTPPAIVSAFLSHSVPAVATWAPFSATVLAKDPQAKVLASDAELYPKVVLPNNWQVSPSLLKNHPDVVRRFLWVQLKENDWFLHHLQQGIQWTAAYAKQPVSLVASSAPPKHDRIPTSSQILAFYKNGTAARWFKALGNTFMQMGTVASVPPESQWLDLQPALSAQDRLSAATYG
jgi:NitT/TauT family transport system substrate-binding protein